MSVTSHLSHPKDGEWVTVRGVGSGPWLSCRELPLALVFLGSLVTPGRRAFPVEKKGVHCRAGTACLEGPVITCGSARPPGMVSLVAQPWFKSKGPSRWD